MCKILGCHQAGNLQGKSNANSTTCSGPQPPCKAVKTVSRRAKASACLSADAKPGHRSSHISQRSGKNVSSRVDYVRESIRKKGFSKEVATLAAESQRQSSLRRYAYIWGKFENWYVTKYKTDASKATVARVADYLVLLKNDGLSLSTILSHKSTICSTLLHTVGTNYSENHIVQSLLKNFKNNIKRKCNSVPDWDFNIVLAALREEPFEPLNEVDSKYLTMKCLFLTAWASAARVSELHALSRKEGHFLLDSRNRFVDLIANTKFIAKNQVAAEPPRKFRIKAIRDFIQDEASDRLLCPVRALRIYKKRTDNKCSKDQKLFVCVKKDKDMAIHSISYWLRHTIITAYKHSKTTITGLNRVTAHEVRAVSTSLAASKHVPIKDIMRKAFWKSESTFTSFYLKDLAKYIKQPNGVSTITAGFSLQI